MNVCVFAVVWVKIYCSSQISESRHLNQKMLKNNCKTFLAIYHTPQSFPDTHLPLLHVHSYAKLLPLANQGWWWLRESGWNNVNSNRSTG